jgi:hypothetical protein
MPALLIIDAKLEIVPMAGKSFSVFNEAIKITN